MRRFGRACGSWCAAVLMLAAGASSAEARQVRSGLFSDVTRAAWYNIQQLIVAAAERMPEEHYGFRPTKEVRTFGEIVGHIAQDHFAFCGATTGRPAVPAIIGKLATKADLKKALQESVAECDMAYGLLTDLNAGFRYLAFEGEYTRLSLLTTNVTHDSEHYGNLVTYLRLKGIVPPSTRP
ncbi:MAG TPA: DinB family protein [Vicinamibacterales bacterium]|nr:DinB family protein [Vicinamibacterales bacterium]